MDLKPELKLLENTWPDGAHAGKKIVAYHQIDGCDQVATARSFSEDVYVILLLLLISPRRPVLLEAVPAVDGPLAVWLEGNLRFLPAVGTGDLVHLARGPVIATTPILVSSVAHGNPFLGSSGWTRRRGGHRDKGYLLFRTDA
jgi:hypothetical protein